METQNNQEEAGIVEPVAPKKAGDILKEAHKQDAASQDGESLTEKLKDPKFKEEYEEQIRKAKENDKYVGG
jgi:hypothetical protein